MEYQVLGEFVRVLKISKNSRIEAPLLQYLSIMIQNMDTDNAIYYCLSNDYINSIITHQYQFDGGDLASYYVSFLRVVSCKLNKDTLCLLVKVHEDAVVSFPLYSEALKFAYHGEKMIQTAVRALTLNIYNVGDDMVYQFVTAPPVSQYFSDLILSIKKQCLHLDSLVDVTEYGISIQKIVILVRELLLETDKIVDDLYYLEDVLSVDELRLSKMISESLISLLVFPMLLPLLPLRPSNGPYVSAVTSLFVVARLLQIVQRKSLINFVASAVLYAMFSSVKDGSEVVTNGGTAQANDFANPLDEMVGPETKGAENLKMSYLLGYLSENLSLDCRFLGIPCDDTGKERGGILPHIFSDNQTLMLASLMLLLVLAESKDLDYRLAGLIGFRQTETTMQKTYDSSPPQVFDSRVFMIHLPQILHALLKVLATQPPFSVLTQLQTGWFLRKLLIFQETKLDSHDIHLFNVRVQLIYVAVLEESSQRKDPFFVLELANHQLTSCGGTASILAWQKMIDAVKVYVLHLHLKAFIYRGDPFENPLRNLKSTSLAISGRKYVSDLSSASFGSEISLGSGIPCKISFSKIGMRDIYLIPIATGISGKLLLLEKHPLHSKRGVVIAIAPLAGLNVYIPQQTHTLHLLSYSSPPPPITITTTTSSIALATQKTPLDGKNEKTNLPLVQLILHILKQPKIDENHLQWLHLQIREFDPTFDEKKLRSHRVNATNHEQDGKWTIGFTNAKACDAARLLILEETNKQRSSVESLLAPLLNISQHIANCQGD
ncbi:hypothetical protein RHGRI_011181 [Rhododendron griersonianum]|uniref:FPL domain-containing protein n=1 Tax=Rhododendron griersonianum TaxID=479676 RepID=A0AAV6KLF0_9ERIC|nr:hypothetical protein RHGRI_011181 [Rhododendron griersonianum]